MQSSVKAWRGVVRRGRWAIRLFCKKLLRCGEEF
jgi:hypothetical protein